MRFRFFVSVVLILGLGVGAVAFSYQSKAEAESRLQREVQLALESSERIQAQRVEYEEDRIPRGVALADFLPRFDIEPATVYQITSAANPVFDMRKIRAGHLLRIGRNGYDELRAIRYQIDADRELWIEATSDGFQARIHDVPYVTELVGVVGQIRDSLFNAVTDSGEGAELAIEMANIFAWDLDFYTDPRVGDSFRLLVEKRIYADGQNTRYGRILAAEYNNQGSTYQAVLFHDPDGDPAYYAPDGKSLKRAFLKSPLKFSARISSHFSRHRFHPVLKRYRPHLGTDYAAPTGTPVQTIGDGRVLEAGRKGGNGNYVRIRHVNGFETWYLHLSRILIRRGQRVHQGQIIGRVGATGLASGPHLDFRIRQSGRFVNFERLKLPPSQPVARQEMPEFERVRDQHMALLPEAGSLLATDRTSVSVPVRSDVASAD